MVVLAAESWRKSKRPPGRQWWWGGRVMWKEAFHGGGTECAKARVSEDLVGTITLRSCVWVTSDGGFGQELREGKAGTTYWRATFTIAVDYGLNPDSGEFRQRRRMICHCRWQGGGWDEQGRVWAGEISDESIQNVQKGFPVYLKTLLLFFLKG